MEMDSCTSHTSSCREGFKATDQRLFNKTFEAVAAIRHVGDSLEAGHYKTMGRFDRKWVWLDDAIPAQKPGNFVSNLENVRLLFLRKK
ncbi:MAG: hypothetical protein GY749_31050 [Desulfobacteraceae bacterium]|nr:hypothetical protein [Desulfobacteraceae bacterium]